MDLSGARRLWAAVRSALRGFRATPLIFVASAGTLTAGLLLLSVYLLVLHNMRSVLDDVGDDLKLVAFFPVEGAPQDGDRKEILDRIGALEWVTQASYVSPDQALERLRKALGSEADLLEGVERNPLPGSIEIFPQADGRSASSMRRLADQVSGLGPFEEVRYGVEWVDGYTRALRAVEWVGVLLGAFLFLVLGAIVAGTVRLGLHAREDEIRIQRLVGAGTLFVRLPFYLEGMAQGLVAAGLAVGLLYGLFAVGLPLVGEPLAFLLGRAEPQFLGAGQILLLGLIGVGLGVGGAALSLVHMDDQT
jgi:cell division transport system permease protein